MSLAGRMLFLVAAGMLVVVPSVAHTAHPDGAHNETEEAVNPSGDSRFAPVLLGVTAVSALLLLAGLAYYTRRRGITPELGAEGDGSVSEYREGVEEGKDA